MSSVRPDADLVRASLAGERRAFEELVIRYQHAVYLVALGYLHNTEDAQDLAQDTFLRAFQDLAQLTTPDKFGAWVRSIARHGGLNALRTRRRTATTYKELEKEPSSLLVPQSPESPEEVLDRDLLAGLPEDTAQVVVLHYLEGLPVPAIARQLGCSPQSIKQRLYRARQHLQQEVLKRMKDQYQKDNLPEGFASQVIARLLEAGRQDRLYMRYDQARSHFREAVEAAPSHPEALLELGRSYDPLRGPSREEVEVLERAAAVAPESLAVLCELEAAYRQPGYEQAHMTIFQRCLELCDHHLEIAPTDVQALKCKAWLLRGTGDFSGAETLFRTAVESAPTDQEACYYLARTLTQQGRREEAIPLYEKTCSLDSQAVWAYFARREQATYLAFWKGDMEEAVALMEEVWELTQRPTEAGNLIFFYSATAQLEKAIEVFEKVKDHLHHPRVWMTAGIGYWKRGDLASAQWAFQGAIDSTADAGLRAEAQLHLAAVLYEQDQGASATQILEEGLNLTLENRTALSQSKGSKFWQPWTGWLAETLESLAQQDRRVTPLLQAVQQALTQTPLRT